MQAKGSESDWRNTLWKIVSNPAIEVVAAILLVVFATWIVVQTEVDQKNGAFPVPTGYK
jgi:hypothetical protein